MCLTCGCGDDRAFASSGATGTTTATASPPAAGAAETLVLERAACWPRTTTSPAHIRALAGGAGHRRGQPDELARAPGKTSLLERTIRDLRHARDLRDRGRPGDHVRRRPDPRRRCPGGPGQHRCGLPPRRRHGRTARSHDLDPPDGSLLFVENVGNLVCPALFDVGEHAKVVIISVTEGDDKPLKYPHMFAAADLVVVNKTDLLPYVDFDLDRLAEQARAASTRRSTVLPLSVRDRRATSTAGTPGSTPSPRRTEKEQQWSSRPSADAASASTRCSTSSAQSAPPAVIERVEELLQRVMGLYGAGLERALEWPSRRPDDRVRRLADDEIVGNLLVLHDLHPDDVDTRVQPALDRVRPYLGSHAGGVSLSGVDEEGVVHLQLEGSCDGCPSSSLTVQNAIEEAILVAAPDVVAVEAEGMVEPAPRAAADPAVPPRERGRGHVARLATPRPRRTAAHPAPGRGRRRVVLVANLDGTLVAYLDRCPALRDALSGRQLDRRRSDLHLRPRLRRPAGRAGARDGDASLVPLPLLPEHGAGRPPRSRRGARHDRPAAASRPAPPPPGRAGRSRSAASSAPRHRRAARPRRRHRRPPAALRLPAVLPALRAAGRRRAAATAGSARRSAASCDLASTMRRGTRCGSRSTWRSSSARAGGRRLLSPSTPARAAPPSPRSTWPRGTTSLAANPVLDDLEPGRRGGAAAAPRRTAFACYLVPIDVCYELVGVVRTHVDRPGRRCRGLARDRRVLRRASTARAEPGRARARCAHDARRAGAAAARSTSTSPASEVVADRYAAGPTVVFRMRATETSGVARARRWRCAARCGWSRSAGHYSDTEAAKVVDLFGERGRWGTTMQPMQLAFLSQVLPGLHRRVRASTCPAAQLRHRGRRAQVPRRSRGRPRAAAAALQRHGLHRPARAARSVQPVPWHKETTVRLPVSVWREAMDAHFPARPGSGWTATTTTGSPPTAAARPGRLGRRRRAGCSEEAGR